jgi:hypothetical protein
VGCGGVRDIRLFTFFILVKATRTTWMPLNG